MLYEHRSYAGVLLLQFLMLYKHRVCVRSGSFTIIIGLRPISNVSGHTPPKEKCRTPKDMALIFMIQENQNGRSSISGLGEGASSSFGLMIACWPFSATAIPLVTEMAFRFVI